MGPSEAHHVRKGTYCGTGLKPSDEYCVPLHPDLHREYHQAGHDSFEKKYGVDLLYLASVYFNTWKESELNQGEEEW